MDKAGTAAIQKLDVNAYVSGAMVVASYQYRTKARW
jgi:hypothetical protein